MANMMEVVQAATQNKLSPTRNLTFSRNNHGAPGSLLKRLRVKRLVVSVNDKNMAIPVESDASVALVCTEITNRLRRGGAEAVQMRCCGLRLSSLNAIFDDAVELDAHDSIADVVRDGELLSAVLAPQLKSSSAVLHAEAAAAPPVAMPKLPSQEALEAKRGQVAQRKKSVTEAKKRATTVPEEQQQQQQQQYRSHVAPADKKQSKQTRPSAAPRWGQAVRSWAKNATVSQVRPSSHGLHAKKSTRPTSPTLPQPNNSSDGDESRVPPQKLICVTPPLDRMVGDMDSDSVIMSGEDTERSLISSSSSGGSGSRDSGGGSGANADNDDDNDDEYDEDFNDSEGLSDTAPPRYMSRNIPTEKILSNGSEPKFEAEVERPIYSINAQAKEAKRATERRLKELQQRDYERQEALLGEQRILDEIEETEEGNSSPVDYIVTPNAAMHSTVEEAKVAWNTGDAASVIEVRANEQTIIEDAEAEKQTPSHESQVLDEGKFGLESAHRGLFPLLEVHSLRRALLSLRRASDSLKYRLGADDEMADLSEVNTALPGRERKNFSPRQGPSRASTLSSYSGLLQPTSTHVPDFAADNARDADIFAWLEDKKNRSQQPQNSIRAPSSFTYEGTQRLLPLSSASPESLCNSQKAAAASDSNRRALARRYRRRSSLGFRERIEDIYDSGRHFAP